jgi:hypothetical protein
MVSFCAVSCLQGRVGEGEPFAAAFAGPGGASVFVVVEPAASGSEEWCEEILQLMGHSLERWSLSLTGGILRAMRDVHRLLQSWNAYGLRQRQIGFGASALAVRGEEAYLGQVGPALAWACTRGRLEELVPRLPEAAGPLGLCQDFYPAFTRLRLRPGDVLALLFTGATGLSAAQEAQMAMPADPDRALTLLVDAVGAHQNFAALIVKVGAGENP